ncbi:MAG: DUF2280 domain-containing protein, partial [Tsuneonella sp.]
GGADGRKQVGRYDPTRPYFAAGEKWRELFQSRRKACLADLAAIPLSHKAYRLNILQQGVDAARQSGNWPLVCRLLEQAAKETGAVRRGQRTAEHEEYNQQRLQKSPEERREAVAELIRRVIEANRLRLAPPLCPAEDSARDSAASGKESDIGP